MGVKMLDYPHRECLSLPVVWGAFAENDRCDLIDNNNVFQELSKLTPTEYDRVRESRAKLMGVRVATLDAEVKRLHEDVPDKGVSSVVEEIVPWEESVNGRDLLCEMQEVIGHHVVLPKGANTALALWSLGTYCIDAWRLFPKIFVTSPQKRSGKSTLMEVMEGLVYRSLLTSNISPAALFRSIEKWKPSLLIDEADTFAKDNNELNGIINAGHTRRTARVIRVDRVGENHEPRAFGVFCPQILAGIGRQRGTLEDRSIIIKMNRKTEIEAVNALPRDYFEKCLPLRRKCMRWAIDNLKRLESVSPHIPVCGNDRARDNWGPLFALADQIGGCWPERVHTAYALMEASGEEDTDAIMLLSDIRRIFDALGCARISSKNLVSALVGMESRPWLEVNQGGPLTTNTLSRMLRSFDIKSRQLKIDGHNLHGYKREAFEDVFARYLPPETNSQNATPLRASNGKGYSNLVNATD